MIAAQIAVSNASVYKNTPVTPTDSTLCHEAPKPSIIMTNCANGDGEEVGVNDTKTFPILRATMSFIIHDDKMDVGAHQEYCDFRDRLSRDICRREDGDYANGCVFFPYVYRQRQRFACNGLWSPTKPVKWWSVQLRVVTFLPLIFPLRGAEHCSCAGEFHRKPCRFLWSELSKRFSYLALSKIKRINLFSQDINFWVFKGGKW